MFLPNRECIETVDMVLHIPLAVEFFYEYLSHNRMQGRKDYKDSINILAFYIDLRMYDKACAD